ncbi:MAG: YraN family protein [Clostridia bacterium]|nr:YraN family protein [Clostridia bacterium]
MTKPVSDRDFQIRSRGNAGEKYVCEYLLSHKCSISATNYKKPFGEIDIIAENEARVIFVEVKTRTVKSMTGGFESITTGKIKKIIKTAKAYLIEHPTQKQIRFDCAQVIVDEKTNALVRIDYIKNAIYDSK